jgi:hypothetical protein
LSYRIQEMMSKQLTYLQNPDSLYGRWLFVSSCWHRIVFSFGTFDAQNSCFCCRLLCDQSWLQPSLLWAAPAQSNSNKVIVVSSTSFFFSSAFDPFDCHVSPPRILVSITHQVQSRSKEVDCCIYPTQSPITSCGEVHHLLRSSPAFVLPPKLFRWPINQIDSLSNDRGNNGDWRWRWMALVAIVRRFGGHRTWFRLDSIVNRRIYVLGVDGWKAQFQ